MGATKGSRRRLLRSGLFLAAGAGIVLAVGGLSQVASFMRSEQVAGDSSNQASQWSNGRPSLISVMVHYMLMAQYTNIRDEKFVVQSPAILQGVLNTITVRHPSMAQMLLTMLILLNGVPVKPNAPLRDGDDIQLIPLSAGG